MLIKEFVKKYVPPQDADNLLKTALVTVLGWVKLTKTDGSKVALAEMPVPENLVTLMGKITEAGFYDKLSAQINDVIGDVLDKINQVESGNIDLSGLITETTNATK
jgi:hypothetical protein